MGKNDKMMKKISKISGIELRYSDLSPLYPPGNESELTTRLAVNRWYVTTESYYGWESCVELPKHNNSFSDTG